jgi:hypothetical protein
MLLHPPCPFCGSEPVFDSKQLTLHCTNLSCAINGILFVEDVWNQSVRNHLSESLLNEISADLDVVRDAESSLEDRVTHLEVVLVSFYRLLNEFIHLRFSDKKV